MEIARRVVVDITMKDHLTSENDKHRKETAFARQVAIIPGEIQTENSIPDMDPLPESHHKDNVSVISSPTTYQNKSSLNIIIQAKPVTPEGIEKLWSKLPDKYRIFINQTDLFQLTAKDESGNININGIAYSVKHKKKLNLKKGEIIIPDIYKDINLKNGCVELTPIQDEPILIDSVTIEAEGENPIPKDEEGNRLFLDGSLVTNVVKEFINDRFIINSDRKYPFYITHHYDVDSDISNSTMVQGKSRKVYLTFSPSSESMIRNLKNESNTNKKEELKNKLTPLKEFTMSNSTSFQIDSENYPFKSNKPVPALLTNIRVSRFCLSNEGKFSKSTGKR